MSLLRSFPKLSFTLVLLSIVGISVAQRSVGLLLVAGALAAISWYLTEGPRGRWLPRWVSNVLVVAVSLNVLAEITRSPDDLLGVLGRFILWLMIVKLYERRTSRDHGHLLGLSLLLMLTGCLQSVDLFFGMVLAAYAVLGLYVLVLYQLHSAQERMRIERLEAIPEGYRLAPMIRPITGRHVAGHFRSLIVGLAIAGFLLGMVVFVLFPRGLGEGAIAGFPRPSQDRRPGYTDEIDLFAGGRITDSRRAVMTVRLEDEHGNPFLAAEPLLLRGAALDRYEGRGRWRTASGPSTDLRVFPDRFVPIKPRVESAIESSRIVTQHFELVQSMNTLFSMYPPVEVSTSMPHTLALDTSRLTLRHHSGSVPRGRAQRYSIKTAPQPSDELVRALRPDGAYNTMLPIPMRDPEVETLARRLLALSGLPVVPPGTRESVERYQWHRDAARVFTRYLHSGEYLYTLDLTGVVVPQRGSGRSSATLSDPVSFFLLDLKRGHCEYFAAGLAFLCLHVDIPARVISGFVAYDYDSTNQRYNIVEANAHAWVEILTDEHRWTAYDPTPPAVLRELHQGGGSVAERLRWFYDSFDGAWSRTIVDFDRAQQTRMTESGLTATLGQHARSMIQSIRSWMDRVNAAFYLGPAGYIYMAFIGCVLMFAIVVLVKLMRRSIAIKRTLHLDHIRGREYQRMLRQLGFYLDMLDVLERAGIPKPRWQPPLAYAHAMQTGDPPSATVHIVDRVTDLFYQARFGGRALSNDEVASAHAMVRELAIGLNVRPKWTFTNVK